MEYCGFVGLIGRPNVGKSTLMNHLIGQKISITSRKPQTTRYRVLGIATRGAYQTVYVDTPGLHRGETRLLNRYMNRSAVRTAGGVDLVLLLLDAAAVTAEDDLALDTAAAARAPVILVLNKVDLIPDKRQLLPLIARLDARLHCAAIVPVSALREQNLETLQDEITARLPEGRHLFPDDSVTDRPMRFLAAELIREKLTRQMGAELPYSASVAVETFTETPDLTSIDAVILVERTGQRRMVIGAGGRRLKKIGTEARLELERLLGSKVYLSLYVKVKSGWADDARTLRSLGLGDEERA